MHRLLSDILIEMHARRARTVLIMSAVALSVGALLAAVGFAATAARQVDAGIAAAAADLVTVTAVAGQPQDESEPVFPPDADGRAESLDLVVAAGRRLDLTGRRPAEVRRTGVPDAAPEAGLVVAGLTPGYLEAARTQVPTGRAWLLDGTSNIVFLGEDAAVALDIPDTPDPTGLSVTIDGREHAVAGVVRGGDVDLSKTVLVPYAVVADELGDDMAAVLLARSEIGAGSVVSAALRPVLRPDAPERLTVSQVVDRAELRHGVSQELDRLALGIGCLLLALTVLLIANSMIVAVMARQKEIGLRRAIGYGRGAIAWMFLGEGAVTGVLGGLAGAGLATGAVVVVAAWNGWTPVLDAVWVAVGPVLGTLTGVVSSAYPALRASAVQPALAVRSD